MRKHLKTAVIVLIAIFLIAQAFRITKSNPPVRVDVGATSEVSPLLRRACYDCHSNETSWPWYSNVAPVSWLVGSDVSEARSQLNFSEWGNYTLHEKTQRLKKIAKEVGDGDMPLWYYSLMHSKARLTDAERNQIKDWADEELARLRKN